MISTTPRGIANLVKDYPGAGVADEVGTHSPWITGIVDVRLPVPSSPGFDQTLEFGAEGDVFGVFRDFRIPPESVHDLA